ncbi:MAG TPA: ATPase [Prolixibacteraceae bacterium]|nr:ATPase [Prolixibacteraceae bacterium]
MHDHSKMNMSTPKVDSKMEMAESKVETIKVWGNCETCKTRIEKAAKVNGVSKATWDVKTKMLSLVYDPSKTNSDDIQKKITAVGHDTDKFRAEDKVYAKLPGCCQYDRKK